MNPLDTCEPAFTQDGRRAIFYMNLNMTNGRRRAWIATKPDGNNYIITCDKFGKAGPGDANNLWQDGGRGQTPPSRNANSGAAQASVLEGRKRFFNLYKNPAWWVEHSSAEAAQLGHGIHKPGAGVFIGTAILTEPTVVVSEVPVPKPQWRNVYTYEADNKKEVWSGHLIFDTEAAATAEAGCGNNRGMKVRTETDDFGVRYLGALRVDGGA